MTKKLRFGSAYFVIYIKRFNVLQTISTQNQLTESLKRGNQNNQLLHLRTNESNQKNAPQNAPNLPEDIDNISDIQDEILGQSKDVN